ncbi:hypothetical protein [Kiloniella laminariae]|uniref:hypothetical protein n=1 Tax=Kiloniella laminariae TaxID=454162 RepID=UPI00036CA6C2|nr:hypothetical protein [Kiloniella laminariae]
MNKMVHVIDHAEKLYGNSKPKFEPELRVETRPVDNTEGTKGHSYFVYRDEDGKEWALSGTHSKYPSWNTLDSQLVVHLMPLDESIDARGDQTPEQRGSRVLSTGTKAMEGWRDLKQLKEKIETAKFEYDHEGPNSNSVTSLGLKILGFDPEKDMPKNDSYKNFYQGTHPGVGDLDIDKNNSIYETPIIDFVKSKQQIDNLAKGFETTIEQGRDNLTNEGGRIKDQAGRKAAETVDYSSRKAREMWQNSLDTVETERQRLDKGWDRTKDKAQDLWDQSTTNLDKARDKLQQAPQYFEDRIMRKVHREINRQR